MRACWDLRSHHFKTSTFRTMQFAPRFPEKLKPNLKSRFFISAPVLFILLQRMLKITVEKVKNQTSAWSLPQDRFGDHCCLFWSGVSGEIPPRVWTISREKNKLSDVVRSFQILSVECVSPFFSSRDHACSSIIIPGSRGCSSPELPEYSVENLPRGTFFFLFVE
jgi:hypothetical protein